MKALMIFQILAVVTALAAPTSSLASASASAANTKPILKCGDYEISQGKRILKFSGSLKFIDSSNTYVITGPQVQSAPMNLSLFAREALLSGTVKIPFQVDGVKDGTLVNADALVVISQLRLDLQDLVTRKTTSFSCEAI